MGLTYLVYVTSKLQQAVQALQGMHVLMLAYFKRIGMLDRRNLNDAT